MSGFSWKRFAYIIVRLKNKQLVFPFDSNECPIDKTSGSLIYVCQFAKVDGNYVLGVMCPWLIRSVLLWLSSVIFFITIDNSSEQVKHLTSAQNRMYTFCPKLQHMSLINEAQIPDTRAKNSSNSRPNKNTMWPDADVPRDRCSLPNTCHADAKWDKNVLN